MRVMANNRGRWIAAGVIVLLFGTGVAYASVPNSTTGQITACYATTGTQAGHLRVIDYQVGQRCKAGERSVSWQQRGVRFRGTWTSSGTYYTDDAVYYGGSSYVAIGASKNLVPTNITKWRVLAVKGVAGTPGAAGAPAPRPSQTLWVAKSGGDFTTLKAALATITDSSVDKPYVVKVGPGVFTESSPTDLRSHVTIEGSGRSSTVIDCVCGSFTAFDAGTGGFDGSGATLRSGDPVLAGAELRNLTVRNRGSKSVSMGLWLSGIPAKALTIDTVKVEAGGAAGGATFNQGIHMIGSAVVLSDLAVIVNGAAGSENSGVVAVQGSDVQSADVSIDVDGGAYSLGFLADDSAVDAHGGSIEASSFSGTAIGWQSSGANSVVTLHSYKVTATGATSNGMYVVSGGGTYRGLDVTAGGNDSIGVRVFSSDATYQDSSITSVGSGLATFGIDNAFGTLTLDRSTVTVANPTDSARGVGVRVSGGPASLLTVQQSSIQAGNLGITSPTSRVEVFNSTISALLPVDAPDAVCLSVVNLNSKSLVPVDCAFVP